MTHTASHPLLVVVVVEVEEEAEKEIVMVNQTLRSKLLLEGRTMT